MECIRKYDIEIDKEVYYGGEMLRGCIVIENVENLRVNNVQVFVRGKAHVEWRVTRAGERRTVKEDQFFIDEKMVLWGRENAVGHHWDGGGAVTGGGGALEAGGGGGNVTACATAGGNLSPSGLSVMSTGEHRFQFSFQLPEGRLLPGSFESRHGTIRYYVRVVIDVPYASPLQGLKYFTVVGPLVDRLDSQYNTPLSRRQQITEKSCLCCTSGHVTLEALLERGSYCCGERLRLKCDVQNASTRPVTVVCRLIQTVEYRINKGRSGLTKTVTHQALEWCGPTIQRQSAKNLQDIDNELRVPVMPPTICDICDPIEISYSLQVSLVSEKQGCEVQIEFPIIILTVPHRILNSQVAEIVYEPAAAHVEGGIYVSPEFLLGQVYDGATAVTENEVEEVVLYKPVYVCVQTPDDSSTTTAASATAAVVWHGPSGQTPSSSVNRQTQRDVGSGSASAEPELSLSTTKSIISPREQATAPVAVVNDGDAGDDNDNSDKARCIDGGDDKKTVDSDELVRNSSSVSSTTPAASAAEMTDEPVQLSASLAAPLETSSIGLVLPTTSVAETKPAVSSSAAEPSPEVDRAVTSIAMTSDGGKDDVKTSVTTQNVNRGADGLVEQFDNLCDEKKSSACEPTVETSKAADDREDVRVSNVGSKPTGSVGDDVLRKKVMTELNEIPRPQAHELSEHTTVNEANDLVNETSRC